MSTFQSRFRRAMEIVGGRFVLTALMQKRMRELVRGERPLVDLDTRDYAEIALAEVLEGKIELGAEYHDPDGTEVPGGSDASDPLLDQGEDKDQFSVPL